jgi:chromosome partitioning protein
MTFETTEDLLKAVELLLSQSGWDVEKASTDNRNYDFIARREDQCVAVLVKNYRVALRVPQVERFIDFIESPEGAFFDYGWLVTTSSYTKQALAYYYSQNSQRILLASLSDGKVTYEPLPGKETKDSEEARTEKHDPMYIGVFTCKGGVGKTTVSAHLAGAMALAGYDVALVDLDPQKNLSLLLGEGVNVKGKGGASHSVTVYSHGEWDYAHPPEDVKSVICDFSPYFEANPVELLSKLRYCLIPTTLNPLGLSKNGHVIKETIRKIRSVNAEAELFVLINNYHPDETQKRRVLRAEYESYFRELMMRDSKFRFIDPEEVAIRTSKQLFYWGYHLYSGDPSQLAFSKYGWRCKPKADFLNLLDYLESLTYMQASKN